MYKTRPQSLRLATTCETECFFRPNVWLSFRFFRSFMLRFAEAFASFFNVSLRRTRFFSLCLSSAACRISACVRFAATVRVVDTVVVSSILVSCLLSPVVSENIGFCSRKSVSLSARARVIAGWGRGVSITRWHRLNGAEQSRAEQSRAAQNRARELDNSGRARPSLRSSPRTI